MEGGAAPRSRSGLRAGAPVVEKWADDHRLGYWGGAMSSVFVNLRNLERIQEGAPRSSRLGTILLAATGSAAVLLTSFLLGGRGGAEPAPKIDPLASLVEQARATKSPSARQIQGSVEFPEILSDRENPTTALAAVKGKDGRLLPPEDHPAEDAPPNRDLLPVVPLPAGALLAQTTVTSEPKDPLTALAREQSVAPDASGTIMPGGEGGFSVQVGSFKEQADAERFVSELLRRGHRAYRQAANVPSRGLWHRVRIGPFKNGFEANLYKQKLEKSEKLTALVIDPEKVEQREQARAAKLAERIRQYGSE